MPDLDLICTWCEENKLRIYQTASGFYVGCSAPGIENCADTTGEFPTEAEAVECATDYVRRYYGKQQ